MGNWRRVWIEGTCDHKDVDALTQRLAAPFGDEKWGPLCNGGICGLPNFADTEFNVVGNLGERDFDENAVAYHLEELRGVAPSLKCVIHMGDDYESSNCASSVVCNEHGIYVTEAQVEEIPEITEDQMMQSFLKQLFKA